MLHTEKIMAALVAKRDYFIRAEEKRLENQEILNQALERVAQLSLAKVESNLAGIQWPGARPTLEHEQYDQITIPFAHHWSNHRQARRWALEVLEGVPTFAVDGSQIYPNNEISIPVGVVQVGWFENPHQANGSYVKNIAVEVLTPNEMSNESVWQTAFPDWQINWRRFEMEAARLVEYMEANAENEPKPLCFFDEPLIISFAQHMHRDRQQLYMKAVTQLLQRSERTRVPLVGYVNKSDAFDLTTMLTHVLGLSRRHRVSDAELLRSHMKWGDRTQVYICARDDNLLDKYYDQVCFVYLKTTQDNQPARVEFPRWLYESGEHERVLDLIRAECVVGLGYPYALETADGVAVLTNQDRQQFYGLFQKFSQQEGLPLRFSRKAISKQRRRV